MTQTVRIELHLLLPEIPDHRDACVARLEARLGRERGLTNGQVVSEDGERAYLSVNYEPAVISLAEVERLARAAGAEIHDQYGHIDLKIRAVTSEDAASEIEAALRAVPGVVGASVSLAGQLARVEFERRRTSVVQLQKVLDKMGFAAGAAQGHDHEHSGWYGRNKEFVWSLTCGAVLLVTWVGVNWLGFPPVLANGLYLVSYGLGGYDLIVHFAKELLRGRFRFDIDLLMLLAAVGAAVLGEWAEGAFLLFLFSLAMPWSTMHWAVPAMPFEPCPISLRRKPGSCAMAASRKYSLRK